MAERLKTEKSSEKTSSFTRRNSDVRRRVQDTSLLRWDFFQANRSMSPLNSPLRVAPEEPPHWSLKDDPGPEGKHEIGLCIADVQCGTRFHEQRALSEGPEAP